jgi:DNA-binding PadR family transcriptional regulator
MKQITSEQKINDTLSEMEKDGMIIRTKPEGANDHLVEIHPDFKKELAEGMSQVLAHLAMASGGVDPKELAKELGFSEEKMDLILEVLDLMG